MLKHYSPSFNCFMVLLVAKMMINPVCAEEAKKSPWKIGGAFRGSFQYLDYNPKRQAHLEFDTLRGAVSYDDGSIIGSTQMRYYWYSKRQTGGTDSGNMFFLQHLWAGYRFSDKSELIAGLNSHPFGLYPYAGNNFYESIAYYAGYEDAQSLGIKYSRKDGHLESYIAFYPTDGGHGYSSESKGNYLEDSATRYSFHAINGHEERNTGVIKAVYNIEHSSNITSEFGFSYLAGEIDSNISQAGWRQAFAGHYVGIIDNVTLKLEALHYENNLNGSPTTMLVGAFGFSNNLATKGDIYMANVSYKFDTHIGPFGDFTLYNDYSVLNKDIAGFSNSYQNVTGLSFGAGKFFFYIDYMLGKNSTYMSPVFYNGLGTGANNNNTGQRFNISLGYYF